MGGLEYAALIVPILCLLVLAEWLISKRKGKSVYTLSDTIVNVSCGMLERLFDFFWIIMMYFVFKFLFIEVAIWHLPNTWWVWLIGLFVGDFLAYWHHRLSHEINFLWAAHIVHHQSEELNLTTVFRVSAFAVINRSFFWIWMPMAGFSPEITTSVVVFIGLFQFVTHSRLVGKLGFLEKIMVTPSHHRVHHARNEKYLDTNYGHVFIIWDKMLGTFRPEEEEPDYGITSGFESANPYRAHLLYWKDLIRRSRQAKSFKEKINVFVKGPTYTPKDVPFMPSEYKVNEKGERIKHRLQTPMPVQYYVFVNVLLTIGAFIGLYLLKKDYGGNPTFNDLISDYRVIILVFVVAYSILTHGLVLDRKNIGIKLEYLRMIFMLSIMPVFFHEFKYKYLFIAGTSVVYLGMFWWILKLRKLFSNEQKNNERAEMERKYQAAKNEGIVQA